MIRLPGKPLAVIGIRRVGGVGFAMPDPPRRSPSPATIASFVSGSAYRLQTADVAWSGDGVALH